MNKNTGFIEGSGMVAGAMDWIRRHTMDFRREPFEINGRMFDPNQGDFLPNGHWGVANRSFSTLSGLCDYMGVDGMEIKTMPSGRPGIVIGPDQIIQVYAHVAMFDQVKVVSETLPKSSIQITLATATAAHPRAGGIGVNGANFECAAEDAVDILMANYHPSDDLLALVDALADIRMADETKIEVKGITTRITTSRKTKTNPDAVEISNPMTLTPIIGFPEIDPGPRKYNVRISKSGDRMAFKLSVVADPRWEADMAEKVERFLKDRLKAEKTENETSWHVFR